MFENVVKTNLFAHFFLCIVDFFFMWMILWLTLCSGPEGSLDQWH